MSDDSDRCPSGSDDEPPQPGPAVPTQACEVLADAGLISVDVMENGGDWTALTDAAAAIREAAFAAANFAESKLAGTSAAIALAGDEEVAGLNASYRGKPSPTNVLSFPAPQLPTGIGARAEAEGRFIGDIILAAETVFREAAEMGIPPKHHLQHLVVHGLLHLSGFDHEDDEAANSMETLETLILAALEIPDPYAESPASAGS